MPYPSISPLIQPFYFLPSQPSPETRSRKAIPSWFEMEMPTKMQGHSHPLKLTYPLSQLHPKGKKEFRRKDRQARS
jgi:hypothetical protein